MKNHAYICDAIRTPFGRYAGALSSVRADDLGAVPLKALMARNPRVDWEAVVDVVYGCANQAGEDNRNVARMSALLAGLPMQVPGSTVNRLCGSGLDALGTAARAIKSGEADLMISLVWRVPQASLEAWLEANPRHWREIAELVSRKLRIAFQIFDQEIRSPMTERVARRLRLASLGWGWRNSEPLDSLRLSQEQLARMLGTSRSSVNKSLRELERFGAIALHYGGIEVKDSALLLQACGTAAEAPQGALRPR
jgi:hypothetical protein